MNIHEHQAKEILNKFGVAVLRGGACVILSLSSSVSFFHSMPQKSSKGAGI
jgi:succinyl-CoA synthetase beta subunit